MKKVVILISVFLILSIGCSSDNPTSSDDEFNLTVIVYVDSVPTEGIEVMVGYLEFSRAAGSGTRKENKRITNSEGKVEYSFTPFDADVQYLCKVNDPYTGTWTSERQANALKGTSKEEKFYLTSTN